MLRKTPSSLARLASSIRSRAMLISSPMLASPRRSCSSRKLAPSGRMKRSRDSRRRMRASLSP